MARANNVPGVTKDSGGKRVKKKRKRKLPYGAGMPLGMPRPIALFAEDDARVRKLAQKTDRSMGWTVRNIIAQYFKTFESEKAV